MKRPLLYILAGLSIGIIFGSFGSFAIITALLVILLISITLYCFLPDRYNAVTLIIPIFFIIGAVLYINAANDNSAIKPYADNSNKLTVTGTITESSSSRSGYVYRLKIDSFRKEKSDSSISLQPLKSINLRWICGDKLNVGTRVDVTGYVYNNSVKSNPTDFNSSLYYKTRGYSYGISTNDYVIKDIKYNVFSYFTELREDMLHIFDLTLTRENAGILKAVILGDKSDLSDEIQSTYRNVGIYHFLAISGLHISILAGSLFYLLRKINYVFAGTMVSIFLFIYCFITGFSISVMRASVMMFIYILSAVCKRDYDLISSACITAVIFLIFKPLYIFDTGFLYSFGAIFGIGFAADAVSQYKNKLLDFIVAAIGANVMTKPITLLSFYKLSIIDVVINILLIPVMSMIVVIGFIVGVTGSINIEAGKAAAIMLMPILNIFNSLCGVIESFPICNFVVGAPDMWEIILIYIVMFFIYWLIKTKNIMGAGCIAALCIFFSFVMHNNSTEFQTDFMYVGQGDCAIVRSEAATVIVDGGGSTEREIGYDNGKYLIMPYLNYCGVDSIDAVFVSHMDSDHIKGIFDIMGNMPIKKIYIGKLVEENQYYYNLLEMAEENQIAVEALGTGDSLKIGNMYINVLSPDINMSTGGDYNAVSLVFNLTYKDLSLLFTGDIDRDTEDLIAEKDVSGTDILKVAHHGSKNSSSLNFLSALNPYFSVISAGQNNSYGHPHEETLEKFKQLGLDYGVTAENGMISVIYKNGNTYIKNFRE